MVWDIFFNDEDEVDAEDDGDEEDEIAETETLIPESDIIHLPDIPQDEITQIGILGLPDHGLTFDQFISAQTGMDLSDILRDMVGESGEEFYGSFIPTQFDNDVWHMQQYPDTCAIVCQEYILKEFDIMVTEDELRDIAIENGYYYPGAGTTLSDVGNLLEHYKVEIDMSYKSDILDVIEKLSNGQKVIVALDSNEIWPDKEIDQMDDAWGCLEPNHAVVVTGYDFNNPDDQKIFLNDPGHSLGKNFEVSLKDFRNAWDDSNNLMVYTDKAIPTATA
jgi:hypothetical protein